MAMPQKISRGTLISQGKERAFFSKLNENRLTRDSFNDCQYYRNNARDDSVYGRGVTYVLVADDRKRIYAYATLKTHSLYYYEEEK